MAQLRAIPTIPHDERLMLLQEIADLVAKAESLNLPDSAYLLRVAKLDLQTKIHDIDDEELATFLNAARSSAGCY